MLYCYIIFDKKKKKKKKIYAYVYVPRSSVGRHRLNFRIYSILFCILLQGAEALSSTWLTIEAWISI